VAGSKGLGPFDSYAQAEDELVRRLNDFEANIGWITDKALGSFFDAYVTIRIDWKNLMLVWAKPAPLSSVSGLSVPSKPAKGSTTATSTRSTANASSRVARGQKLGKFPPPTPISNHKNWHGCEGNCEVARELAAASRSDHAVR
jgi:hypothetical protein